MDKPESVHIKPSQYNFIFTLSNSMNSILLYNSRTNALLRISGETADNIRSVISNSKNVGILNEILINELEIGGFLVNQELDEIKSLKIADRRAKFNTSKFTMTIAPTLSCNFNCPYCYQTHTNQTMTKENLNDLKRFMDSLINDRKIKQLSVSWYGGEPLLVKNMLFELQEYFYTKSADNGIIYQSGLVTNGYLLDEDTAKKLKETGTNFIQITLDGNKELHDKRRVLKNGSPTFERIYENIKTAAKYFEQITLRVNVDKENLNAFESIVEILENDGLIPKVQPYPAQVDALTDACSHISANCLTHDEFALYEVEIGKNLLDQEKDFASYPSIGVGCGGVCDNSAVIGPQGFIYKCWNDVGVSEKSVGRLVGDSFILNDKITEWLGYDLFEFEECRNCGFLPICLANCQYEAIVSKHSNKKCTTLKQNLEYILKMKYVNEVKKQLRKEIS